MRHGQRWLLPSRSKPTSPWSSADASRAAVPGGSRSAMGTSTMPPWLSASSPRCATGRPSCSVAVRSRPPSRRSSAMRAGMRRSGSPAGSWACSCRVQRSRTGPAAARTTTPPRPAGSTVHRAAAQAASIQAGSGSTSARAMPSVSSRSAVPLAAGARGGFGADAAPAGFTPRTLRPARGRRASRHRTRPAGRGAGGGARTAAPRAANGCRSRRLRRPAPPAPAPRASA